MSNYDIDILEWSERQASLLRRRGAGELVNDADLDWSNIAEEVEDVGRSSLRVSRALLLQALLHDLKAKAWPLSSDVWSLQPIVAALGAQNAGPAADPTAAANILRYQLVQATEQYPGSRNALLYLSSEVPGSPMPQSDFDLRRGSVHGGAVLAYGRGGGIEVMGQRLIFFAGYVIVLLVALLPAVLCGGLAGLALAWLIGKVAAFVVGAMVGC